jgi:hypothetical protein
MRCHMYIKLDLVRSILLLIWIHDDSLISLGAAIPNDGLLTGYIGHDSSQCYQYAFIRHGI